MILAEKTPIYRPGKRKILLTACHIVPPGREVGIRKLVERVARETGAMALLGRCSRKDCDLNRQEAEKTMFRILLKKLVVDNPGLVIFDIHGSRWREELPQVDIGTHNLTTVTKALLNVVAEEVKRQGLSVGVDAVFRAQEGTVTHTFGHPELGTSALQLELRRDLRDDFEKAAKLLKDVVVSVDTWQSKNLGN